MSRSDPRTAAELVATGKSSEGGGGAVAVVKRWLRSAALDNLALKAVAFLLALTLFILVHSDEDEIVPATVKLTYAAPREGLTLVEAPPDSVRVSIQGSRRRLRRLVESELDPIQVTLTNTGEFVFQSSMVRPLPEDLSVVSISPPSISLVYESTKNKRVALRARTVGSVAPGYRVASITVEPSRLEVRGAESAVARIEELVTQAVSIEGAQSPVEKTIALAVPPFQVQVAQAEKATPPQDLEVVVRVAVVPAQGQEVVGGTAIALRGAEGYPGNAGGQWKIEPETATLVFRGDQLVLDALAKDELEVFVWVYPADSVARVSRQATIEVIGVPNGVAVEKKPTTVKLTPK